MIRNRYYLDRVNPVKPLFSVMRGEGDARKPVDRPLPQAVTTALELLATHRYAREIGGIVIDGIPIDTSESSQRKISELRRRMESGELLAPFEFKAKDGWHDIGLAGIVAIDKAVADHVQQVYKAERRVSRQVSKAVSVEEIRTILKEFGVWSV